MKPADLIQGTIVQINPKTTTNPNIAGCFLVVLGIWPRGVSGWIESAGPGEEPGVRFLYKPTWEEVEPTGGIAKWTRSYSGEMVRIFNGASESHG